MGIIPRIYLVVGLEEHTIPGAWENVAMMKTCPLCITEMPERYNYCYQCGEYVGDTATLKPQVPPEVERQQRQQERVIHYGCLTMIMLWAVFGVWFFLHMNR